MNPDDPTREIRAIVSTINEAWRTGDVSRLTSFFHPQVVVVPPGFADRVVGREACLQSYADFARQARVHEFSDNEPAVDVFGGAAIALCPFRIVYELERKIFREKGHDLLVFSREADGWQVVWRTLRFEPEVSPQK